MKKSLRSLLLLTAITVPLTCILVPAAKTAPDKPVLSGKKYKNIKVLKNLPADKLGPLMHEYCRSLSVSCDFCHKGHEWASDENPQKNIARGMIRLTQSLNKKGSAVRGKATCFMCHHGHPEPITTVPAESR